MFSVMTSFRTWPLQPGAVQARGAVLPNTDLRIKTKGLWKREVFIETGNSI